MSELLYALAATFLISLISFIGVVTLAVKDKTLKKILLALVAFSAGGLLGGAFLHLLPEALEESASINMFLYVMVGFIFFFIIEKILKWRHCHAGKCAVHSFTYMSLIGDGIHNLIDGFVIVSAFLTNTALGIATTIAVAVHEIPQEIGDFGVLVYGGFTKKRALAYNFLTALAAVAGAAIGFFIAGQVPNFALYLLPFAAGGFIYIAASDLVPELHKEADLKKSLLSFAFFIIGVLLMWALRGPNSKL